MKSKNLTRAVLFVVVLAFSGAAFAQLITRRVKEPDYRDFTGANGNKIKAALVDKFMIDTGAGSTVLHIESAKKMGCDVGPMDQTIYGVGEAVIKEQKLLSADMFKDIPGARKDYDAILGAEFMSQLRAVITYKEQMIFLQPDA